MNWTFSDMQVLLEMLMQTSIFVQQWLSTNPYSHNFKYKYAEKDVLWAWYL